MSEFGAASTTDEVFDGKDLSGKRVFVTGRNSGLALSEKLAVEPFAA